MIRFRQALVQLGTLPSFLPFYFRVRVFSIQRTQLCLFSDDVISVISLYYFVNIFLSI